MEEYMGIVKEVLTVDLGGKIIKIFVVSPLVAPSAGVHQSVKKQNKTCVCVILTYTHQSVFKLFLSQPYFLHLYLRGIQAVLLQRLMYYSPQKCF